MGQTLKENLFYNVTFHCQQIKKKHRASEVFYIQLDNVKAKALVDSLYMQYGEVISQALTAYKKTNGEKYKLVLEQYQAGDARFKEIYEKILKEAAEQSYRNKIPELMPLAKINDLTQYISDINLVAYEESSKQGEHSQFYNALKSDYKSITIIVGPEGGFDQKEIDEMKKMGILECSLGKRILRSETAPLYMLSVIGYSRELV